MCSTVKWIEPWSLPDDKQELIMYSANASVVTSVVTSAVTSAVASVVRGTSLVDWFPSVTNRFVHMSCEIKAQNTKHDVYSVGKEA